MFVMGSLRRSLILKHIEQCFVPLSVHRLEVVKNRIMLLETLCQKVGREPVTTDHSPSTVVSVEGLVLFLPKKTFSCNM